MNAARSRPMAALHRLLFTLALVCGGLAGLAALPAQAATGAKNFDHLTTGFPLTGQHESARCEDCHVRGIFKGTPAQCAACHTPGTLVTAVMIPNNHFPTSQPCSSCHTTATFYGAHFPHSDVAIGTCSSCHNGVFAKGVTPTHIPIGVGVKAASCDLCHSTVSFRYAYLLPPSGHMPVSQPCAVCHVNNDYVPPAAGSNLAPHMNHAGTGGACLTCHAPSGPAYKFEVTGFTLGGSVVTLAPVDVYPMSQSGLTLPGVAAAPRLAGKQHILANVSCDSCHTDGNFTQGSAFQNGGIKHASVTGQSCLSCHTAATAFFGTSSLTGVPVAMPGTPGTPGLANHIPINGLDCAASGCHASNDVPTAAGTNFATNITPALSAGGHTSVNLPCEACHTVGMAWKLQTGSIVTPNALGNAAPHIPPDNAAAGTTACSACHSATSFGTLGFKINSVPLLSVSGHSAVSSMACTTCHESADRQAQDLTFQGVTTNIYLRPNTAFSGLSKGVGLDPYHGSPYLGYSQDCVSCHTTAPPFASAIVPPGHIKLISPTPSCNDCHAAGYIPGQSKMKHADVAGTCTSCHATTTVYLGTGQGANGQPWQIPGTVGTSGANNHMPTNSLDCAASGCHGNTAANDTMTTTGTGFITGTTPQLSTTGHATVKLACEACHTIGMAWKGVTTLVTPAAAHVPPDNVAAGGVACSGCHSATSFGVGGWKLSGTLGTLTGGGTSTSTNVSVMPPASHTAVASAVSSCATCHEAGLTSFQGVLTSIFLRPDKGAASAASNGTDAAHGIGNALTADCAQCHNPNSFAAGLPTNHIKLITPTPACTDCHAGGYGPGLSTMKHSDVTGTCTSCHYTTAVFSGTGQGTNGQPWQIPGTVGTSGSANHIPINSLDCAASGCHGNTTANDAMTATGVGFKTGTTPLLSTTGHATVNLACETCHAVNMAWYGVTTLVGATTAHIPPDNVAGSTALACTTCHSATSFGVAGWKLSGTLGTLTTGGTGTTANVSVMSVAMHTSVKASVASCDSCHQQGLTSFQGVLGNIFLRPDLGAASGVSNGTDTAHGSGNAATADCLTCHSPSAFVGGTLPSNHMPLPTPTPACADCHAAGYGPTLSTMKHADVTTITCTTCHFTTTVYAGTAAGLNGGRPWQIPGTPGTSGAANHIAIGSLDCAASGCHASNDTMTTGGTNFKTNLTPVLSAAGHSSVTASVGCQACHNIGMAWYGVTSLVTPAVNSGTPAGTHIPPYNAAGATENCSDCHVATSVGTGGFKLAGTPGTITAAGTGTSANVSVMSIAAHSAVLTTVATCDTCHQQGLTSWLGVGTSIFLRPDQGAASGLSNGADTTHAATTATSGNPGTSDCSGCHGPSSFAGGAPSNHIPIVAGATCTNCHVGGTGNNVTPTAMPHTGYVSGTCASCHNSATKYAGPVFTPATTGGGGTFGAYTSGQVAFQPRQIVSSPAIGASGGHIPLLPTGVDCGVCHLSFAAFSGTAMVHTGITTGCATCHASGAKWYGETYTASNTVRTAGAAFSPAHVPITPTANTTSANAPCEVCHSPTTYTSFGTTTTVSHANSAAAFMTYSGGGSTNSPKRTALRTPTCILCHNSGMKWYGVSLSTASMGSHQNSQAGDDCYYCHSNPTASKFAGAAAAAAFAHRPMAHASSGPALRPGGMLLPGGVPAAGFTHVGVSPGGCVSCHSPAGGATPQPGNHIPVAALSCDTCHRTSAWLPALYAHTGVTGNCASCHYPGGATAKPGSSHMLTSRSCENCHNTSSWTPQSYIHSDLVYSPHTPSVTCVACHTTNTEQVTWKYPNFAPGCAGCHGGQFSGAQRAHRSKGPAVGPPRAPQ